MATLVIGYTMNMGITTFEGFEKTLRDKNILKKYGFKKIGVFGSFARGERFNDIDLFIDEDIVEYKKLLELQSELEKEFKTRIDVVLKKYANPIILHRAQKDMRYVTE